MQISTVTAGLYWPAGTTVPASCLVAPLKSAGRGRPQVVIEMARKRWQVDAQDVMVLPEHAELCHLCQEVGHG